MKIFLLFFSTIYIEINNFCEWDDDDDDYGEEWEAEDAF